MSLSILAIRNLTRRRTRTVLTILGVAIAIAFTVTILSISEGQTVLRSYQLPTVFWALLLFIK